MRAIMKRQLLHTPEGVRDIYNDECEKKMLLQDQLYHILRLHVIIRFRRRHLSFLIYSDGRSAPRRRRISTSFLTGKATRWC